MKLWQASWVILNIKNPLGKSIEKILKDSEEIFISKCASVYLFELFIEDIIFEVWIRSLSF